MTKAAKSQEIFKLESPCHISIKVEAYKAKMSVCSVPTAKNVAMLGRTANNLPIACWVEATTCTRTVLRKGILLQHQNAATADMWRKRFKQGSPRKAQDYNCKSILIKNYNLRSDRN
jgi:hypothetical protein